MARHAKKICFGRSGATSKQFQIAEARCAMEAAARRIRNSQRWKDCRLVKLRQDPLCENPKGEHDDGVAVVATQVHHIKPLVKNPSMAFDLQNLMSVCDACHGILSQEERKPSGTSL